MTPPRIIRRQAALAILLIWTLACGGLAWATRSAIILEHFESQNQESLNQERTRALAMSRLDAIVEPVLARERARPYSQFRSRFKLARAFDSVDGSELKSRIMAPSPLENLPGPDWMLLHFQVSETQGWSSPQITQPDESSLPAGAIPAAIRPREAKPENWFAALKQRYSLPQLLQEFELALSAEIAGRQQSPRARPEHTRPDASVSPHADPPGTSEYARRAARLLELERENFPLIRCEPELVALENLDSGTLATRENESPGECVQVSPNLMMPVWLDLTLDGRLHLALIRTVTVETSRHCTLQGVLIDWDKLRELLEGEVADLFPSARIIPLARNAATNANPHLMTLQTIPARLEPGSPAVTLHADTGSLSTLLSVAWLATLAALSAVTYGIVKYVAMTQRRLEFVAAVTHELRTPLTSFQLYGDLLADMPADDDARRREYVQRLRDESSRLARLVENVLAYSRMGDSGPQLNAVPLEPAELLQAAAEATRARCLAADKSLILDNRCPPGFTIETDREFVLQILVNLVENACKYSAQAEDPAIWLTACVQEDGTICFDVEDAGKGVSGRDRRQIFEPFQRAENARHSGAGGVGLGLAMSKFWAHSLGGVLILKRGRHNPHALGCFSLCLPSRLRT